MKTMYCMCLEVLQAGACKQCLYYQYCQDPSRIVPNHTDGSVWKVEMLLKYMEWKYGKESNAENKDVQRSESDVPRDSNESLDGKREGEIC